MGELTAQLKQARADAQVADQAVKKLRLAGGADRAVFWGACGPLGAASRGVRGQEFSLLDVGRKVFDGRSDRRPGLHQYE